MTQTGRKTEETAFIADVLRAEAEAIERIARQVTGDDSAHWKAALDLLESCTGHV
ncbi:MAG: hypothetical protein IIB54_08525, partial [Planctomycetes bacterium]|nr:hypothetical protein [Planctomycetota bacterium]